MDSLQPHRQPTVEDGYPTPKPSPRPMNRTMNSASPRSDSPSFSDPSETSTREEFLLYSPAPKHVHKQMKLFDQNDELYASPQTLPASPQSPYPQPTPTPAQTRAAPSTQSTIDLPPHIPGTPEYTSHQPQYARAQESASELPQGLRYNPLTQRYEKVLHDPRNGQYTASPQQQAGYTSPSQRASSMSSTPREGQYNPQSPPQGNYSPQQRDMQMQPQGYTSAPPQGWQQQQMMAFPHYGVPQTMSGFTTMYHHPQFGPIPFQDLGQQHGLPQRRPAGGHRYGKVTVSGNARAIRGNVNNDLNNTTSRVHDYGDAETRDGGRLFDGDVTSREMESFWALPATQQPVAKAVEQ